MADIFGDLADFGLADAEDIDIYKKKDETIQAQGNKVDKPIVDIYYDKTITCPVCSRDVKYRSIKTSQLKLDRTDLDLRPIYEGVEPSLYEVIACNICGYAALKKVFLTITPLKQKVFKEKVSYQFKGRPYPETFTYDIAIERYKLALYDAIVLDAKDSEKAYICLKIAWLYRGYYENAEKVARTKEQIELYQGAERTFIKHAIEGFKIAYEKEKFPVLDLSEITVVYLLGELSRRIDALEDASRWISIVLASISANKRLKERARDSKDLILKKIKSAE